MTTPGYFQLISPDQEQLLNAALFSGEKAITAWNKWRDSTDWQTYLEPGSYLLLPLLYINLQKLGVEDPSMGQLKGIYRHTWSKNQILFRDMAEVVEQLHHAGIETMILKDIFLSLLYYNNNGARPITDMGILVPLKKARMSMDVLKEAGWTSPAVPLNEMDLSYSHAIHLHNRFGNQMALHWRSFDDCNDAFEKDFWDNASPVKIIDLNSLAPSPTDMLFQTIINGVLWSPQPPICWIADAIFLINSTDFKINWQQLMDMATRHHVRLRLKTGLKYLDDMFYRLIPASVMTSVMKFPVSYLENIEYRFMANNSVNERHKPYPAFCCHLCRYRRLNSAKGVFLLFAFLRSLKWRMNARNNYDFLCKGFRITANMFLSRPFQFRHR
jgi:Uncharacterised nucleotidyltransferase